MPSPLPRRAIVALFVACASIAVAAPPAIAQGRSITELDLYDFVWVADPQVAPDGSRVAFVRVTVNAARDGYDTALWVVDADGRGEPRRLTAGPRDLAPRWSPDGSRLAFLRAVERHGQRRPQIHVIALAGGEAQALTDLPRGASAPLWSPDGRRLAFTSTTSDEDLAVPPGQAPPARSDVRVITTVTYRRDNIGYVVPAETPNLWTVPADAGDAPRAATRVTRSAYDETIAFWATDGSRLFFLSNRVDEPWHATPDSNLWSVPVAGGDPRLEADIRGPISEPSPSPDGRRVAFVGVPTQDPVNSYQQADLFVATLGDAASARNLTAAYDFDIDHGLAGDQHAPRGGRPGAPVWSADGRSLVVGAGVHGRANLVRIDVASGAVTPVTTGDHELVSHTATANGTRLAAIVSSPVSIGEVVAIDVGAGPATPRRLTDVNRSLFSQLTLTPPDDLWLTSFDGTRVHTLVQRPPGFDPAKKYPVILNIHGGPHAAFGHTFFHEMQWMAAKGYVVIYPNPRGSTTYGQDFGDVIQYRYPGDDGKDLMAAVEEVIRRGWGDPNRLGVTGGSGGGVLTNYLITQTDRFKAAVSQRSISDWAAWWYTADFSQFQPFWFRGAPFEDPKDFAERSAITHVAKIRTPLMLIEGERDFRTPPGAGGEQLFRALMYLKRPVVMVQFPGESHDLSRSGTPTDRVERLRHIMSWFDKWL